MIKLYLSDQSEWLKDGYYENHTMICSENYPPFYVEVSDLSGTVEIYSVNEEKLRAKEWDEILYKSEAASQSGSKIYYEESAGDSPGVYRYKLILTSTTYWSDLFRIIDAPTRVTYNIMDSSFLKFYDADVLEFQKDGYFENNTYLEYATLYLGQFYFDSELTISSVTCDVYSVNETDLQFKTISTYKQNAVTCTFSGSKVYLQQEENLEKGLYRVQVEVTPTVGGAETFYSELFCITETASLYWILINGYWDDLGIWLDYELWYDS
jgi:hypothetical protein